MTKTTPDRMLESPTFSLFVNDLFTAKVVPLTKYYNDLLGKYMWTAINSAMTKKERKSLANMVEDAGFNKYQETRFLYTGPVTALLEIAGAVLHYYGELDHVFGSRIERILKRNTPYTYISRTYVNKYLDENIYHRFLLKKELGYEVIPDTPFIKKESTNVGCAVNDKLHNIVRKMSTDSEVTSAVGQLQSNGVKVPDHIIKNILGGTNMKSINVKFSKSSGSKLYEYVVPTNMEPEVKALLESGKTLFAVVPSVDSYRTYEIGLVASKQLEDRKLGTKFIVGIDSYEEQQAFNEKLLINIAKKQELFAKAQARYEEANKMALFEKVADSDPVMKELLEEMKGLGL